MGALVGCASVYRSGVFRFFYAVLVLENIRGISAKRKKGKDLSAAYWVLFQGRMLLNTLHLLLKLILGGFIHQIRIRASRDSL
jgi:hypothetical protein